MEPNVAESLSSSMGEKPLAVRIWQYKLHYVIVISAMIFLFVFKIWPLLQGLYMSMVDYKPFLGLFASEWIGFGNYRMLFSQPYFRETFVNTVTYKLAYFALSAGIAFAAAISLSGIRSPRLRGWSASVLVLPYFLPSVLVGYWILLLFNPSLSPFSLSERPLLLGSGSSVLIPLSAEVFKTSGISILAAVTAIAAKHASATSEVQSAHGFWRMTGKPAARAIIAVALIQLSVFATTDQELLLLLISPLTYENLGTIDYFVYQTGLMNGQYSMASAAWFVKYAIQIVFAAAAYFVIRGSFLADLFHPLARDGIAPQRGSGSRVAGTAVSILSIIAVVAIMILLFVYPFFAPGEKQLAIGDLISVPNLIVYVLLYGAATIVSMLFALVLAYPMTVNRLPGRTFYRLFLIICMFSGPAVIHEYMFFRNAGMVNTVFPLALLGITNFAAVFVLKSIFNSKHAHLKMQAEKEGKGELAAFFTLFVPNIWKPLIGLGVLQFVLLWHSYLPSVLYINDPSRQAPLTFLFNMTRMEPEVMADPAVMQAGALLSLLPVALFLVFRRWLTSEVMLSALVKK
ncbi:hypothetical protein [Paenibacillus soyae]|uniref:Uncharacterized protein n=1 Tax=Paenibacillus soyae TaxID=2969249 RepID=A0A9X2MN13_9BACL|nr:hypothetical protein [Paenibacillus soyae]MCR2803739.1 hypothetical protein [Paenibacillus soyae]